MAENPFTPTFGANPLFMAGEDAFLNDMKRALVQPGHDPMLTTLVSGNRGSGKTALLAAVREKARNAGWVAVGCAAMPGLLEDIYEQTLMATGRLSELAAEPIGSHAARGVRQDGLAGEGPSAAQQSAVPAIGGSMHPSLAAEGRAPAVPGYEGGMLASYAPEGRVYTSLATDDRVSRETPSHAPSSERVRQPRHAATVASDAFASLEAEPASSASFGGASDSASAPVGNWRTRMTQLLQQMEEHGAGLLITVDEIEAEADEVLALAKTYQLFLSEGRKVALVMAGLPFQMRKLVEQSGVSFLSRAWHYDLKPISNLDVSATFRRTFESSGKKIDDDALALCVNLIGGSPYMMQLVGYRTWNECQHSGTVTMKHAKRGIAQALEEMDSGVFANAFYQLSPGDVRYLQAMLPDARESRTADVARRMGKSSGYAAKYKTRLLAQGVVTEPARGWVAFGIPGFRYYLESRLEEPASA